jgi:hypothetical protein
MALFWLLYGIEDNKSDGYYEWDEIFPALRVLFVFTKRAPNRGARLLYRESDGEGCFSILIIRGLKIPSNFIHGG